MLNEASASRLLLLAAALLFSTGGAVIKSIGLSAWQVASFRSGVAALAILLLLPGARRLRRPGAWLVGAAFAATMILFVCANRLTTAANAIFLQATAPLYLVLLSPWLLKERARRRDLLYMVALAAGMALFFLGQDDPTRSAPRPLAGNVVAACSGLTWAATILGLRWLGRGAAPGGAAAAVAAGSVLACAAALPFALPVASIAPADVLWVLYLGVFQIGLAYAFLTRGVRRVPALEASLLLLLEPVLNPFWAWLSHGEVPSPWSFAACALILGASVLNARGA
ncbi:MAG: DMT family transporter [Planctomycetes bacterium]|nr:DMT family transporter [Planctomycetota bacterium]